MIDYPFDTTRADIQALIKEWPLHAFDFRFDDWDIVVVAGAYKGKVMDMMLGEYPGIKVIGFEPQDWARKIALERLEYFDYNPDRFEIRPRGIIVGESRTIRMWEWGTDACSILREGQREDGKGFFNNWREEGLQDTALYIFNMEGYEYELVHDMHLSGALDNAALAVQWHLQIGGRDDLLPQIFTNLGRTHRLQYDHFPQWTYHIPIKWTETKDGKWRK